MWTKTRIGMGLLVLSLLACRSGLKMEKMELEIQNVIFTVEIARSQEEQQQGLMYRDKMGAHEGMIFVYPQYIRGGFWMKNTRIPLSIAFIGDNGKILDIKNMEPYSEKTVMSAYDYMYALEVNKGAFDAIGAKTGDFIKFLPASP